MRKFVAYLFLWFCGSAVAETVESGGLSATFPSGWEVSEPAPGSMVARRPGVPVVAVGVSHLNAEPGATPERRAADFLLGLKDSGFEILSEAVGADGMRTAEGKAAGGENTVVAKIWVRDMGASSVGIVLSGASPIDEFLTDAEGVVSSISLKKTVAPPLPTSSSTSQSESSAFQSGRIVFQILAGVLALGLIVWIARRSSRSS